MVFNQNRPSQCTSYIWDPSSTYWSTENRSFSCSGRYRAGQMWQGVFQALIEQPSISPKTSIFAISNYSFNSHCKKGLDLRKEVHDFPRSVFCNTATWVSEPSPSSEDLKCRGPRGTWLDSHSTISPKTQWMFGLYELAFITLNVHALIKIGPLWPYMYMRCIFWPLIWGGQVSYITSNTQACPTTHNIQIAVYDSVLQLSISRQFDGRK